MPLMDRPILSTIERNDPGGMIGPDGRLDPVDLDPGLLDPRSGRSADVQRDLRALDGRKKIAAKVRREGERAQNRSHESANEYIPPGQRGHEEAPIEAPDGFESPFKSALKHDEGIAGRAEGATHGHESSGQRAGISPLC